MKTIDKIQRSLRVYFPVVFIGAFYAAGCSDDDTSDVLDTQSYFNKMKEIIYSYTIDSNITFANEKAHIEAEAEVFQKQRNDALKLKVPDEVKKEHEAFLNSNLTQYESYINAAENTPASVTHNNDNYNEWLHKRPDVGYTRFDWSADLCKLKFKADDLKDTFNIFANCQAGEDELTRTHKNAGSKKNPVSSAITMVQEAREADETGIPTPNAAGFEYDTIFAKANTDLEINFDNRNPSFFVFNLSLFKGSTNDRVEAENLITATAAYGGVRVHTIRVNLPPGLYTYVDTVHPVSMKGTLVLVE